MVKICQVIPPLFVHNGSYSREGEHDQTIVYLQKHWCGLLVLSPCSYAFIAIEDNHAYPLLPMSGFVNQVIYIDSTSNVALTC